MNLIRYLIDFFHINGAGVQSVKYAKGQTYPESDETLSHVEAGHAEPLVIDLASTDVSPATDTPVATATDAAAQAPTDPAAATPAVSGAPAAQG